MNLNKLINKCCGDSGYFRLERTSDDILWEANTITCTGYGETREEAVINLLKELKK